MRSLLFQFLNPLEERHLARPERGEGLVRGPAAVFPPGTAYVTDVGMTGPYESVIGRDWTKVLHTMLTQEPVFFEVAKSDARISGALFDVDPATGRATSCKLVHLTEEDFLSRWRGNGGGWAFVLLGPPPMPVPRN
jgi:hypothetical protein